MSNPATKSTPLSRLLLTLRNERGISAQVAALGSGCGLGTLHCLEAALSQEPPIQDLRRLATFYRVPLLTLLVAAGYVTDGEVRSYRRRAPSRRLRVAA